MVPGLSVCVHVCMHGCVCMYMHGFVCGGVCYVFVCVVHVCMCLLVLTFVTCSLNACAVCDGSHVETNVEYREYVPLTFWSPVFQSSRLTWPHHLNLGRIHQSRYYQKQNHFSIASEMTEIDSVLNSKNM